MHDELEMLGRLRLHVVHQGTQALKGGDASAIGEHVGYGGGVGFRPVRDSASAAEGFQTASKNPEKIHALPQRVSPVGDQRQRKLADRKLGLSGAEASRAGWP